MRCSTWTIVLFGACLNHLITGYEIETAVESVTPRCKCGTSEKSRIQKRIMGGATVQGMDEYPWHAVIKKHYRIVCNGALINGRNVLTAASCFYSHFGTRRLSDYGLRVGVGHLRLFGDSTGRSYVGVKNVVIHEDFDPFFRRNMDNNIAIVYLDKIAEVTIPVCLPFTDKAYEFLDSTATATGWGKNGYFGFFHNQLQQVSLVTKTTCENNPTNTTFCVSANPNANLCGGDKGSPLVVERKGRNVLVGIAIDDLSCGYDETRFTLVGRFLDWISKNANLDYKDCEF